MVQFDLRRALLLSGGGGSSGMVVLLLLSHTDSQFCHYFPLGGGCTELLFSVSVKFKKENEKRSLE